MCLGIIFFLVFVVVLVLAVTFFTVVEAEASELAGKRARHNKRKGTAKLERSWEDSLKALTLEQLEKQLVELPIIFPNLADWQLAVRRKVITDTLDKRRGISINSK